MNYQLFPLFTCEEAFVAIKSLDCWWVEFMSFVMALQVTSDICSKITLIAFKFGRGMFELNMIAEDDYILCCIIAMFADISLMIGLRISCIDSLVWPCKLNCLFTIRILSGPFERTQRVLCFDRC